MRLILFRYNAYFRNVLTRIKRGLRPALSKALTRLLYWRYWLPSVPLADLFPGEINLASPTVLDRICLPPHHGPAHDDFTPLMKIARSLNPAVVLELGTAHGNTVTNLCVQCPSASIFTVNAVADTQTGKNTTFELGSDEIGIVYRQHGYERQVRQIFANTLSLDLSRYMEPASVDLAVIDACHDTEYVINDFHKVRNYIKPGGYVLFHDTHPSMAEHLIGSYRACLALRRDGYDILHIQGTWWAAWRCVPV